MFSEFIKRQKAKSDLNKCFMNAGLYKTYKNSSGRQFYSYPKYLRLFLKMIQSSTHLLCLMAWTQRKL